jgi:hypothetical protein
MTTSPCVVSSVSVFPASGMPNSCLSVFLGACHSRCAGRGKPARGVGEIQGHPPEIHDVAVAPDLICTITGAGLR